MIWARSPTSRPILGGGRVMVLIFKGEEPRNTIDPGREWGEALGLLARRSLSRSVLSFGLCRAVGCYLGCQKSDPPHPILPTMLHPFQKSVPGGGGGGRGVGGPRVERSWTAWAMDLCGIQIPRPLICMLVRTGTPSSTVRLPPSFCVSLCTK